MGNASVIEVSCPGCGAKFKAPDNVAGKKTKCAKCGMPFRIPGTPAGNSTGDPKVPSAPAMPVPVLPEDENAEVMMAEAVEAFDPPPVAVPVANLAALPSADPFDFGKPKTPAPAAKPAFGAARATPVPAPPPKPPAAPPAKPAAPVPAPAKDAALAPALPPAAKAKPAPEPKPLSLDDDDFQPIEDAPVKGTLPAPKAKVAPQEERESPSDDPFAFSASPAPAGKSAKAKRRDDGQNQKTREDEEKPAKAKRRDDDNDQPRKKHEAEGVEGRPEPPAKSKGKAAPQEESGGAFNPFADFGEPEEATEDEQPAKAKRRDDEEDKPRKNRKRGEEEEADDSAPRRYRRPEKKGLGKAILITGVIGVFALGLGLAAVVAYVKHTRKEAEQARKDAAEAQAKKDEKKDEGPAFVAPPDPPPRAAKDPEPKGPKNPEPKAAKDPEPKAPKDPDPKGPKGPDPKNSAPVPAAGRPPIGLPALKTFTLGALPPAPAAADRPRAKMILEVPLAAVKRVFPPLDPKSADTCVLIQTSAGVNGKGEKLALDSYGPAGNRVPDYRIEYDGDGSAVPVADVFASAKGVFFLSASAGKLSVWNVIDKKKIADGVQPYAEKPEHAKAGLAAAFFSPDPNLVVTVSTAGAVLLYDLTARKPVSDFVPPDGAPGRVALGQSVAVADGHGSVAVAVAGVLYQVKATPGLEVARKYDLGGDVGRSFALAVSGTPGRLLYAFEAAPDKAGKKEKAVLGLPLGGAAKHVIYRWPDGVGDPKGALWANDTAGGVVSDRGVVWFDDDEGTFVPLVLTQPTTAGQFFGGEHDFWYAVPHPTMPTKSTLVALAVPFNDFAEYQKAFPANQPLRATRIDGTGLAK